MKDSKDLRLIDRYLQGDEFAFNDLYRTHHVLFKRVAYEVLNNSNDVNDVIHESMYKMSKYVQNFRRQCSFHHWASNIVRNTGLNLIKKRESELRRSPEYHYQAVTVVPYTNPLMFLLYKEMSEAVFKFYEQHLTHREREVVFFKDNLGYNNHETAELLDSTYSNITSSYYNAMKKVQKYLPELGYLERKVYHLRFIV